MDKDKIFYAMAQAYIDTRNFYDAMSQAIKAYPDIALSKEAEDLAADSWHAIDAYWDLKDAQKAKQEQGE